MNPHSGVLIMDLWNLEKLLYMIKNLKEEKVLVLEKVSNYIYIVNHYFHKDKG